MRRLEKQYGPHIGSKNLDIIDKLTELNEKIKKNIGELVLNRVSSYHTIPKPDEDDEDDHDKYLDWLCNQKADQLAKETLRKFIAERNDDTL